MSTESIRLCHMPYCINMKISSIIFFAMLLTGPWECMCTAGKIRPALLKIIQHTFSLL